MNSALLQRPRPHSHPPTPWLQRPSGAVRATLFINELQMCYDPFIQQWVRERPASRIPEPVFWTGGNMRGYRYRNLFGEPVHGPRLIDDQPAALLSDTLVQKVFQDMQAKLPREVRELIYIYLFDGFTSQEWMVLQSKYLTALKKSPVRRFHDFPPWFHMKSVGPATAYEVVQTFYEQPTWTLDLSSPHLFYTLRSDNLSKGLSLLRNTRSFTFTMSLLKHNGNWWSRADAITYSDLARSYWEDQTSDVISRTFEQFTKIVSIFLDLPTSNKDRITLNFRITLGVYLGNVKQAMRLIESAYREFQIAGVDMNVSFDFPRFDPSLTVDIVDKLTLTTEEWRLTLIDAISTYIETNISQNLHGSSLNRYWRHIWASVEVHRKAIVDDVTTH